jgi:hypothetical protein
MRPAHGQVHGQRGEWDEMKETMLLLFLCITVPVLLFFRQRLVDRMRRDMEAERVEEERQRFVQQAQMAPQPELQLQPQLQPQNLLWRCNPIESILNYHNLSLHSFHKIASSAWAG